MTSVQPVAERLVKVQSAMVSMSEEELSSKKAYFKGDSNGAFWMNKRQNINHTIEQFGSELHSFTTL